MDQVRTSVGSVRRDIVKRALAGALPAMAAAAALGAVPVWGQSYYLVTDVPERLSGIEFGTDQIVRAAKGVYVLDTVLPSGTELLALYRRPDGMWLLTPAHPLNLSGTEFEPRDVLSYDGTSFAMALDGGTVGIPEYARIDSLFLDDGDPILSFDVPVNLGGVEYGRSDLVRFSGGSFSLLWNSEAARVPAYSNVAGADRDNAGSLVVSFDAPTNISGTEFLPGQLTRWDGAGFSNYFVDPKWPLSAQLRDFSFVLAAGVVPDGAGVPGVPLTVTAAGGNLTLSWGTSCATTDTDYEVYEGTLGSSYSHTQKSCSTGGATTMTFVQPPGSTYYLVVPRNSASEGSYGRRTGDAERPQGASVCLPQVIAAVCP